MIEQLTDILADQAKAAARKGAVFAAIGVVILIGAGFLLAAVYMALAASFGGVGAALAIGGTLVTLALVALAIVLERDPGDAIDHLATDENAARPRKTEDDVMFDLLVHSAIAGYATGQGNKTRMQSGFDQIITDLVMLGVFEPPTRQSDPQPEPSDPNAKMAG